MVLNFFDWAWERSKIFLRLIPFLVFMVGAALPVSARADHEIVTVPLILGDYYVWAYTEAFEDHAEVYGWSTAGVDGLGWTILATSGDYSGLFFVNLAGIAKTVYPVVTLLASSDSDTQTRAWIALGTHTVTLITLGLLGQPALSVQSFVPRRGGEGLALAMGF